MDAGDSVFVTRGCIGGIEYSDEGEWGNGEMETMGVIVAGYNYGLYYNGE